jgi:hypothetical protein
MEKFRILTGTHANWNSDVSFHLMHWKKAKKRRETKLSKYFKAVEIPNERKQILCNLSNSGTWQEMSSQQF